MNINHTSLVISLPIILGLLYSCAMSRIFAGPVQLRLPQEQIICENPEQPLLVKIALSDGQKVLCLIDTGTTSTELDRTFERLLGQRLGKAAMNIPLRGNVSERVSVYAAPKLYLDNVPLMIGKTILVGRVTGPTNFQYKAILGMDCLCHYCIQIDFTARKIRFLDPDSLKPEGLGTAFPLSEVEGTPVADMALPGERSVRLMLDTGLYQFVDCTLPSDVIRPAFQTQKAYGTPEFLTFTKGTENQVFLFPTLNIGGKTYNNLHAVEMQVQGGRVQGFIGLRFIARHVVTFDFPKRKMYLRPISP